MAVAPNADRGARFLDERLPGWRDEIDTERLNLGSGCNCVLGELFGTYDRGMTLLGLSHREAVQLGFFKQGRQTWELLTRGWRRVLGR